MSSVPLNPAGPFEFSPEYDEALRQELTEQIRQAPGRLREVLGGLSDEQLDTKYRNWTVRQIVHHIGDSHLHSMIRFKWALTEHAPLIKAYEEADWVALPDAKDGDVQPGLALLDGLHCKWVQLLESMSREDFHRMFQHPQSGQSVTLWEALNNYAWHGRHHTAQIVWLAEQNGWGTEE